MTNQKHTDELRSGVTFVTPTRRLAHHLRARHDAACVERGLTVWPTPDVVTWSEFLRRSFEADRVAGRTSRRWLVPAHGQFLFEQIMRRDDRMQAVIAPSGIGAMAQRSWTLLHEYEIPLAALAADYSPEVQAFAHWAHDYAEWLQRHAWLDPAQASSVVAPPAAGSQFELIGFDQPTPAQASFIGRLVAAGVVVTRLVPDSAPAPEPRVVECRHFDDEIDAAVRWAAQRLVDAPGQRLALIVRGLAQQRARVRRILDRVLVPAATVAGGPAPESAAYELAAARPLAERPVVAALLAWQDALADEPAFARCSGLLRSPFDRASGEATARAELDAWLRRHETAALGLERLATVALQRGCPQFAAMLRAGIVRAGSWARRRLPSEWAHEFSALARDLGWPGPGADTREHQAMQRWQVLLGEFGAGDDVVGTVGFAIAVRQLRELAGTTLFEPQEIDAPLLVIDPETCVGMRFDAAWVCGLDVTHWPPPASPDPFLPRDWQMRQGVPGANAELAAAAAGRTLERLRRDAGELILSVPGFDGEAPLLPSPLVLGFARDAKPAGWSQPVHAAAAFASRPDLERLVDGAMPAIAMHEVARGGARLVELQASCPFRASVETRLGGQELEEPAPGVNAMARGNVAHGVLKRFWDEVRDHRNLAAMTRVERVHRVHEIVTRELAPLRADAAGVLAHLLDLEQRWLEARVMELLECDLARPPFTVTATEMETVLEVGGMQLRLQLDRVDRLADGSLAVIDYKTGSSASPADWMGERPRSPQLPLYVRAVGEERVGAVAFGRVRTGATGYEGYVRDQELFSGLTGFVADRRPFKDYADWGGLLQAWRRRLEIIATEYAAGDARLAPDPARACRYCHLPGLCRIGEVRPADPDDDYDDDVRS